MFAFALGLIFAFVFPIACLYAHIRRQQRDAEEAARQRAEEQRRQQIRRAEEQRKKREQAQQAQQAREQQRALNAERRVLEKEYKQQQREQQRIISSYVKRFSSMKSELFSPSSLNALYNSLCVIRQELPAIPDFVRNSEQLSETNRLLSNRLSLSDAEILTEYIDAQYQQIIQSALDMVDFDVLSKRLTRLFSSAAEIFDILPIPVRIHLRNLKLEARMEVIYDAE